MPKKKNKKRNVGGKNLGYTPKGFEKRKKDYDAADDWFKKKKKKGK